MGNSSSAYVSGIDRKTLLERTSDTPYILNRIMEELLKKHKIQDYTYLSSPGECKKYVVGLSATLDSIFHHIDIVPQMGRDGVLYFRPIKDVVEQQSEKDKATRQSLCVILSYFYTRIFQIFGALALTLIDDATAMSTSGIYDTVRGLRSGPPGMGPYYGGDDTTIVGGADTTKVANITPTSVGGADIRDIGPFEFLSEYLEKYSSDEYKFIRSPIGMKIKFLRSSDWSSSSKKAELNVSLGSKSGKEYYFIASISANYTSSSSGKSTIRLHIGSSIKVTSRTGTSSTTYTLPSDIKRDLIIDRIRDDRGRVKYVVEGEDFSAIEAFYDMIRGIVNYISEKGLVGDSYTYIPTTGTRTYDSTGTLAPLRIDRTLQNLQKDKPLAHCIARAIQLLDTRPIEGGRALSYVCKSKFMESRSAGHTGPSRSGIPEIGSSLDTSPGMAALSQLFFDVVRFGMTDVKMSDLSLMQYEAFLKEMSKLVDTNPDAHPKKLDEVKNRKGCDKSGYSEKDITVPKEAVPSVLKKVSELYTAQLQHNANAMAILNQLFLIERDSPRGIIRNIYIHPNIFKKGIAEVERLNIITRNVLIKYYTNCERIYQEGAEIAKVSSGVIKSADKPDGMPGAKPGIVAKPVDGRLPVISKPVGLPGAKLDGMPGAKLDGLPGAKPAGVKHVQWAN